MLWYYSFFTEGGENLLKVFKMQSINFNVMYDAN